MRIPILDSRRARRDREGMLRAVELVAKAVAESGTIEKAVATGNVGALTGFGPGVPTSSWGSQNTGNAPLNQSLLARMSRSIGTEFNQPGEAVEQAMAEQGLTWAEPFAPGRPIDPYLGFRVPARTRDYTVGENVQITPRWRRVSFQTLKALYNAYDIAQICVRHLINDVRTLDWAWVPLDGVKDNVDSDIEQAQAFFRYPDKRQPFRAWLAEFLQDVLRWDAGCLYVLRTNGGDPLALEVVDGTTIIPLIDFYGRVVQDVDPSGADPDTVWGGTKTPAYTQIIQGLPFDWFAADDILYQPLNPLPESQYGLCALEAIMLTANTDIRFQWHFLQYFTDGTLPAGFMEAPPDMSDPAQISRWQETWDAFMAGDQSMLNRIRWVPAGAKFTPVKNSDFNEQFPLYLLRRTCAAFGVTPNDLGFTEDVNRATGDTQVDVQQRVGLKPVANHVADLINLFAHQQLGLKCQFEFDEGESIEDRVSTAQAEGIYIDHGVISPDEPRARLGYPIDQKRPVPRFINNARSGPVPLIAIESMSGDVDAETYGPAAGAPRLTQPMPQLPGTLPVQGSPEAQADAQATAQMQRDLISQANGKPTGTDADGGPVNAAGEQASAPGGDAVPKTVAPPPAPPDDMAATARGTASAAKGDGGLTVGTGIQGSPLSDDEDDEDDDAEDRALKALATWRKSSKARVRRGRAPRPFVSDDLPMVTAGRIWAGLAGARTVEGVDAAFAAVGKATAPR